MDFQNLTRDELIELRDNAAYELNRRDLLEDSLAQLDRLSLKVKKAEGHQEEDEWRHPGTVGFPKGWVTRRRGRRYESLISNNVWEPGDPDDPQNYRWWKDLTAAEEQGDTEWSGASVEYFPGDERTYDGQWYRAQQHHISQPDWTPPAVPALWLAIEGPSDG